MSVYSVCNMLQFMRRKKPLKRPQTHRKYWKCPFRLEFIERSATPSGINWHRSCSLEATGWDIIPEGAASYRWDKFARTSLRAHRRIGRIPKIHADGNILPQETSRCALLPARFNARSQAYRYNLSKGKTGALRPWTVPSLRVSLFLPCDENL